MTDAAVCYVRCPGVVATPLPDGTDSVLLNLETQVYFMLNDTGTWLWERLAEPQSAAALADGLTAVFDVDLDTARASVDTLLAEMAHEHLVAPA